MPKWKMLQTVTWSLNWYEVIFVIATFVYPFKFKIKLNCNVPYVVVWSGANVKVKCGCCSMEWGKCYSKMWSNVIVWSWTNVIVKCGGVL